MAVGKQTFIAVSFTVIKRWKTPQLSINLMNESTKCGIFIQWDIAAAAAKSLQLCLTLCDAIDGSPPGSPVPGILQARTLECGKEINPIENSLSRGLAPGHQQGATETHAFVQ